MRGMRGIRFPPRDVTDRAFFGNTSTAVATPAFRLDRWTGEGRGGGQVAHGAHRHRAVGRDRGASQVLDQKLADPPLILRRREKMKIFVCRPGNYPELLGRCRAREQRSGLGDLRVLVLGTRNDEQRLVDLGDRVDGTQLFGIDSDSRCDYTNQRWSDSTAEKAEWP